MDWSWVPSPLRRIYSELSVYMYYPLFLGPGPDSPPPPRTPMTVGYLFSTIRTNRGMLVNVLALLCAVLIGVQALLGSRRRRLGSKAFVRYPLWAFYTISFPVVSYTIGLVQSVEVNWMSDDSLLLWAVGLLLLLGSVNGMSAFSRKDIEQSKGMLANHVVQTLLVLWLLFSRSDVSTTSWVLPAYFLLCWIYSIFRMAQRMTALRKASSDHGLVRSATVVADYMEQIVEDKEHDPKNLSKCKYLVHGEEKDLKPPSEPPYYLTKVGGKVVTVDMIWKNKGELLCTVDKWGSQRALKDTCLSFALFKLLKRRFCGNLDIAEAGKPKTMEFVVNRLLANDNDREEGYDYERAFRVVEVELSFLYDFFYTKYPVLFPTNRLLGVIRFFVLLGFIRVLVGDLIMDDTRSRFDQWFPEFDFIYFNNVLLVVMILTIDILQGLATGYSNWALVQFVCDYILDTRDGRKQRWWKRGCGIRRALMKLVAAWRWRKSAHCWDNKLGQYSLLKSYDYNPTKTGYNALSWLSMRMMEPTRQGRRREPDVTLTAKVKEEVLECLKKTGGLPSVGRSFKESARQLQLPQPPCVSTWSPFWACDDLPKHTHKHTHTHTVLVWHIATTMCEILDTDSDNSDERGEILDSSSNGSDELDDRQVATTLSAYCAYLLAFVPDMLPDNSYKAMQILDAVVEEARRADLGDNKDKNYMRKRCKQMFELGKEKPSRRQVQDTPPTILVLGACLGRQLIESVEKPQRWKLLKMFWVELVLFLAPSNNADVHAEHLANGGEFITHLWALLTHAGIVERPPDASPV